MDTKLLWNKKYTIAERPLCLINRHTNTYHEIGNKTNLSIDGVTLFTGDTVMSESTAGYISRNVIIQDEEDESFFVMGWKSNTMNNSIETQDLSNNSCDVVFSIVKSYKELTEGEISSPFECLRK